MTDDDWDERYRDRLRAGSNDGPAPFLNEVLPLLPRGRALDLACGLGENALLLASQGYDVLAVDFSEVAIEDLRSKSASRGIPLQAIVEDLRSWAIPQDAFEVVTCFYYLDRSLFPAIVGALGPKGVLVYETFTTKQRRFGPPRREEHLLHPGELRSLASGLQILRYREEIISGPKAIASLVAVKPVVEGASSQMRRRASL